MKSFAIHLRSKTPLLAIQSFEENRFIEDIIKDCQEAGYGLYRWTMDIGLVKLTKSESGTNIEAIQPPLDPPTAIRGLVGKSSPVPEQSAILLPDLHLFDLRSYDMVRAFKDFVSGAINTERVAIIIGADFKLPTELEKEIWQIEYAMPTREELRTVLERHYKSTGEALNGHTDALLDAAKGLTEAEAAQAFAISWAEKRETIPAVVQREKAQAVKKGGLLEYIEPSVNLGDVGGMVDLKRWFVRRGKAFSKEAIAFGLTAPKGALLVGVPGAGKSHVLKAVASEMQLPLLKLDVGKVFGSLVGQSESNIRNALHTAEAIAPCVLFLDEIEKGLSGSKSSGQTDGGTSARVMGTFLQWMQDKTAPVFVVATANDVSQLPPEMLRKGRWDELWYVDLPTPQERAEIWKIHIGKTGRKPDAYPIAELADRVTDGFTGAEIEAAVREAMFDAYDNGKDLEASHLLGAIEKSVPLSKTMAAEIESLRTWAKGRTRPASPPIPHVIHTGQRALN